MTTISMPHIRNGTGGWRSASLSLSAIAIGLWSHSIPNAQQIQTYAELRVREALQTGAAGNMKDAEAMLAGGYWAGKANDGW